MKNQKQLYIIPGFGATALDHWFGWLENIMAKEDFFAKTINFPNSINPKINSWLKCLEENIPSINENTFFVAHSLGCVSILRFLQEIKHPKKIGGYIFVAGFYGVIPELNTISVFSKIHQEVKKTLMAFSNFSPNFSYLSSLTKNKIMIASANDYVLPFKFNMSKNLGEKLNAEFIVIKKGGHFLKDDGFKTFPLLYELLMNMVNKKINI